jgi:Tfp pilus assembly protein PilF
MNAKEPMKLLMVAVLLLVPCLSVQSCARESGESAASDTPAERELRAGYCDYQRKNYAGAQSHFSKALELDPTQKYAPFLIATMLRMQFKPGDKSPENIAIARQAIAAYQKTIDNPNSEVAQKENADKAIVLLYGQISQEEQQRELLSRATSPARSKNERAEAYTVLASQDWNCSYEITERNENKRTIERNGKTTIYHAQGVDSL